MRPSVIVLDVNETLSDMSSLGDRFAEVGARAELAPLWFASVLRDGFALTLGGDNPRFADVARADLLSRLAAEPLDRPVADAVDHVLGGFAGLGLHPDVAPGLARLSEAGFRLVTLSNGAASVAERLLSAGGVREHVERVLSVADAGAWKPARAAYEYATRTLGAAPEETLLVAVHPWDLDGARRCGWQTAWVDRAATGWPAVFEPPTHTVSGLDALADRWR